MVDISYKPSQIPYFVRSIGLGVIAVLIGLEISGWVGFVLTDLHNHTDFPMYYRAAMLIRNGHSAELYAPQEVPYGYSHPAFEALLFVPLTFLSFNWAYIVWCAVGAGLVILCGWLLQNSVLKQISPAGALGMLLAFFPISFAIMNGQDSVLTLLFAVLSFRELTAGNEFRSGTLLGLIVFRFQFLIPCLILLGIWKLSRMVAGALLMSSAMMLISIALTGFHAQGVYYHLIRDLGHRSFQISAPYFSSMAGLRTFLLHLHLGATFIPLCVVIAATVIWRARNPDPTAKFLFAITVACIVNSYLYVYDMCVLALPIVALSTSFVLRERYRALLLPITVLAFPLLILMTGGARYLWLCGLMAPALLAGLFAALPQSEGALNAANRVKEPCGR